jgi:hypothetical protein
MFSYFHTLGKGGIVSEGHWASGGECERTLPQALTPYSTPWQTELMLSSLSRIWGGRTMLEENERSATATALKVNRKMQAGIDGWSCPKHRTGSSAKAPANRQGATRVLIVNCTSIDVGCNLARPWLPGTAWPKQHGPSKIQLLHGFPSWASTPTPSWKVQISPPCNLPLCLSYSLINTQNNNHHNVRKETGRRPGTASSKAAECRHESRPHPPGRVGERCTHPDSRFSRFGAH